MKGILIPVTDPVIEVDFDTLESVQEHVGGYVESHRLRRIEQNILFDEDGLSKSLSINYTATALLRACGFGKEIGAGIRGPVLIAGPVDSNGWTEVPEHVRRQIFAFCAGPVAATYAFGRVTSHTTHTDPTKGDAITVRLGLHQAMEGDVELTFHANLGNVFEKLFGQYVKVTVEPLDPLLSPKEFTDLALHEAKAQGVR